MLNLPPSITEDDVIRVTEFKCMQKMTITLHSIVKSIAKDSTDSVPISLNVLLNESPDHVCLH